MILWLGVDWKPECEWAEEEEKPPFVFALFPWRFLLPQLALVIQFYFWVSPLFLYYSSDEKQQGDRKNANEIL